MGIEGSLGKPLRGKPNTTGVRMRYRMATGTESESTSRGQRQSALRRDAERMRRALAERRRAVAMRNAAENWAR